MSDIQLPARPTRRTHHYDVFISYRRSGGDKVARLFQTELRARGFSSFLDLEQFTAGPFDERLLTTIEGCRNFLVILSPHAFDPSDTGISWFQSEIAHALKTRRNIIPIMVDGFDFRTGDLPEVIQSLEKQNAVSYSHDFFDATVDRVAGQLQLPLPRQFARALRSPYVMTAAAVLFLVVGADVVYRVVEALRVASERSAGSIVAAPVGVTVRAAPDTSALRAVAEGAMAGGDFALAAAALNEAITQAPDDASALADVSLLLRMLSGSVEKEFQRTAPGVEPGSADSLNEAMSKRSEAARLEQSGKGLLAAESFIESLRLFKSVRTALRGNESAGPATSRSQPRAPERVDTTAQDRNEPAGPATSRSQPHAPERVDTTAQDRNAINAVLQRYVDAYKRRDAEALRVIWPLMPDAVGRGLAAARSYQLELIDPRVDIQGDTATVTCVRRVIAQLSVGRPQSSNGKATITLARGSAGWNITTVQ